MNTNSFYTIKNILTLKNQCWNIDKIFVKSIFTLIFSAILATTSIAQDKNKINEKDLQNPSLTDREKISLYLDYSKISLSNKPKIALEYAIKSIEISKKLNNDSLLGECLLNAANIYQSSGNYPIALEYYFKALEIFQKSKKDAQIAMVYNKMGIIFYRQTNYDLALEYYLKSLKLRIQLNDKIGIANSYNNIGIVYQYQKDYDKALEFYFKSLEIKKEIKDMRGQAVSFNNIGEIFRLEDSLDKALKYYQEGLRINRLINDSDGISTNLLNIGQIYMKTERSDEALNYLNQSLKLFKQKNDLYREAENYNLLGLYYFNKNQIAQALSYYKMALENGYKLGTKDISREAALGLSKSYERLNNFKDAFLFYKIFKMINDSIQNYQAIQKFTQQEMQYKFDQLQKAKEFEQLQSDMKLKAQEKRQTTMLFAFLAGITFFSIIIFVIARKNRIKQKTNQLLQQRNVEIIQQKEEIQSQANNLEKLNSELKLQTEEITKQRNNLERLNFELFEQKENLIEEKKKSEMLYRNILPDEITQELITHKRVKPKQYDLGTIMFTDFYDFTGLSKELTLLDLVNELDTYFAEFDTIIEKYNIEKIKTVGDSYHCVGGIPLENKSNPLSVVLAGMEIQRFMERMNRLQAKLKFPLWKIRIGIHSGALFTGVVGKTKFAYDIFGESVLIAHEIEKLCQPGKIYISGMTYEKIKDYFECVFVNEAIVKDNIKIAVYDVQSIKSEYSIKEEGKVPNSNLFKIIKEMD